MTASQVAMHDGCLMTDAVHYYYGVASLEKWLCMLCIYAVQMQRTLCNVYMLVPSTVNANHHHIS